MKRNAPPATRYTTAGMQGVSISLRAISRTYGRGGAAAILRGINLEIEEGEILLLTGPSGCGKTTLLNLVAGLDRPTSGELLVAGEDIGRMAESRRATWRAETVGMIFQHHLIPPGQTAMESVALPLVWHHGTTRAGSRRIAAEWLDRVGLGHLAGQRVERLSGGQRQRIAIARALASNPLLVLADEPTAHLDTETGKEVTALLREHVRQSGATMIAVSHEHDTADWGASRAVTIRGGRLDGA